MGAQNNGDESKLEEFIRDERGKIPRSFYETKLNRI